MQTITSLQLCSNLRLKLCALWHVLGQMLHLYFFITSFIFWDYDYTVSPFSFLNTNSLRYLSLFFFKFMTSFLINCYIHIYIFLNTTSSVCIILLVLTLSKLNIWYWIAKVAPLWRRLFLLLLAFISCLWFFVQGWALFGLSLALGHVHWLLISSCIGNLLLRFHRYSLWHS